MPPEQRVSASEVLASAGADKPITGGTFLQRTGLLLAAGVGALASFVIVVLVVKWAFAAPPPPSIPVNSDPSTVKTILDNYKALEQIALEPYTTLFDSIVVKVLLPIFASILGYIFGSRSRQQD